MKNVNYLFSSREPRLALSPPKNTANLFASKMPVVIAKEDSDLADEINALFPSNLQSAVRTVCLPSVINTSMRHLIRPVNSAETEEEIRQRILKFYSKNVLTVQGLDELIELVVKASMGRVAVPKSTYLFRKMFGSDLRTSYSFTTSCCKQIVFDFKTKLAEEKAKKKEKGKDKVTGVQCPAAGCKAEFGVKSIISSEDYSFR